MITDARSQMESEERGPPQRTFFYIYAGNP